jgi:NADH:ubiquinone oxidoreductase subunit
MSSENPNVEVVYLNTNEEAKFHAHWHDTLQHVWDEAYKKLGETKREHDEFQCHDGHSLMGHLNQTLEELRERHICKDRKFAIRSETGGA